MSLGRRLLVTSCLVFAFAFPAATAQAGPFMEGIVESVFKTAEKEFRDAFTRGPRTAPTASYRPSTRATPGRPRLFRSR